MKFGKKNHVKLNPLAYNICLLGESKIGKALSVDEPILTENGWIPMGDIQVGMNVFSEDGNLYKVTGVYPQGIIDTYKISFSDGTSVECSYDHLWSVSSKKQRENMRKSNDVRRMVLSTKDIVEDKQFKVWKNIPKHSNGGYFAYKYSIPINECMNFKCDYDFKLSPYALGLLLGDGGLTDKSRITFTNAEDEIFEELYNELKVLDISFSYKNFKNHRQANLISSLGDKHNKLSEVLVELNLAGVDSRGKFIPKSYMFASKNDRLMLLSGIINTDGNIKVNGTNICITTYSYQLGKDVAELARSLGFVATLYGYDRTDENSTDKYDNEIEYHVRIIGNDYSELHLSSKHKKKLKKREVEFVKSITNVEYVGEKECQCIKVDSPNHTFITNDYIVTHNTTLIKEVCEKLTDSDDGYMFLEIGQEQGADAIEGINYVNCPVWEMDYDELTNSAGFMDVCEDVIDNKTTEYPDLKVLIFDTYDQLITISEQQAIKEWNNDCRANNKPEKIAKTINAAWGGFGRGEKKAMELMFDMVAKLRSVGVSVIIIGHVKSKDVTDVVTGETYQTLTSDQQANYFNALKKNLHFLGLAYYDRTIIKEKTGRKVIKGKNQVDEEVKRIKEEVRKIKFRDDNYAVDSGSRFSDIVPEIDLDADQFIQALKDAILSEQKKSGNTIKQTEKEEQKIEAEKKKRIAAKEKQRESEKELNDIIDKIVGWFTDNKTELDVIKPIMTKCKELGYNNPKEISSIEDANTIFALIQ